nr:hypothetical protein [Candidatus Baldrarchaeota archaeon]
MEEILYDTNILIDLLKQNTENIKGYTTALNIVEYPKILKIKQLNIIYPTPRDYKTAITISKNLYKKGKPVPAIDIITAAIAVNRKLTLLTKNIHFKYIKEVEEKLQLKLIKHSFSIKPS